MDLACFDEFGVDLFQVFDGFAFVYFWEVYWRGGRRRDRNWDGRFAGVGVHGLVATKPDTTSLQHHIINF